MPSTPLRTYRSLQHEYFNQADWRPSPPFESLSVVLLEGWNRAVPAMVNGHCAVLKGQVRRANGGLF